MLLVYFLDCDLCLALSYFYLYAIFFLQKLRKSREEMRAVIGYNGKKTIELSHAAGTFLINDV